jgi:hypothetical protein
MDAVRDSLMGADYNKLRARNIFLSKSMQNVVIQLTPTEKVIIGINRMRRPNQLYVMTPSQSLKYTKQ